MKLWNMKMKMKRLEVEMICMKFVHDNINIFHEVWRTFFLKIAFALQGGIQDSSITVQENS